MSQTNILLEAGTNELEIIEFFIEDERPDGAMYRGYYGMNVVKVLEIIRRPVVTEVPSKHHKAALGTFNLRGRVLPLVDLALWLGKKARNTENSKVIVSEFSGSVTAFLVSGVTRIHRLTWNQVEAPDAHMQSYTNNSITGVVRLGESIVFLLDMEQIIASMNPMTALRVPADGVAPEKVGNNWRILIADDSSSIRHAISDTLSRSGFQVTTTASGREAWDMLSLWKQKVENGEGNVSDYVDLLISDIEMPEMDGHNLTRRIKEDPLLKNLPVVLFSSLITDALRHKGASVGADDQISKPDLPSLARRAAELIRARRGV